MIVVMTCGIPGSGKTTLAHAISSRHGFPILSFDDYEVNKELWGNTFKTVFVNLIPNL